MQYLLTPYALPIPPWAWWEGAFNEQELDWLKDKAASSNIPASVGFDSSKEAGVNPNVRRAQVSWLSNTQGNEWVFEKLAKIALNINAEHFRFDLTSFGEDLQLTNYDHSENGMYGWHTDYGSPRVSRKLSMVLQLTDPEEYEGGELQIMTSSQVQSVPRQRGLVAVFPSYVLHQVTPVTQGNRQSLVAWVSGPGFK